MIRLITCRRWFVAFLLVFLASCNKLVSISDPVDQVVDNTVFSTDIFANAAVNGIYKTALYNDGFCMGNITLYGGLSSDELGIFNLTGAQYYMLATNRLTLIGDAANRASLTDKLWVSAYATIYTANAVIKGLAASTSVQLHEPVRKALSAESKFLRAFSYFYLVNFFGDVPLALTTDHNAIADLARSPQNEVYKQIVKDLEDALQDLPAEYPSGASSRVRANKWAAAALLARVHLFMGSYNNAAARATEVINNAAQYNLDPDLNKVFLTTSKEAIWQINHQIDVSSLDAAPEGMLRPYEFSPEGKITLTYVIPQQLLNAFEPGDQRREKWIAGNEVVNTSVTAFYPNKYKIGGYNATVGGTPVEYATPLRLAEQYLIRAEAQANGAGGGLVAATADLNVIRARAGLPALSGNLDKTALLNAVAHEWQIEFFCEWGHRWFNLKRTGKARTVLSAIPYKQPWAGDHQLLYPIPPADIKSDKNLQQNPGY